MHDSRPAAVGPLELLDVDGEKHLRIAHIEHMPPFLMSVLSSSDLWMFVASNGGLTAGRQSAERCLFPYETVDRLYERPGLGGPVTLIRSDDVDWQPFDIHSHDPAVVRSVTKSATGDAVAFEEIHERLALGFRYEWAPSDDYGWVRTARLWVTDNNARAVEILDGLLDILPAGVALTSQQRASNLIDAYRHTELHEAAGGLGLYSLSSLLTDRAEPAEALRVNVVWQIGLQGVVHLSPSAVSRWRRRVEQVKSRHLRGQKGAFVVESRVRLEPGHPTEWSIVGDVSVDAGRMAWLRRELTKDGLWDRLRASVRASHNEMVRLAAAVDGLQHTGQPHVALNHLSNALFNGLRGGVPVDGGCVPKTEMRAFVRLRNREVAQKHHAWLANLPASNEIDALRRLAASTGDVHLARLVDEMMPLAFGRRHGDPSRPWNRFSIRTKTADGARAIHYEGNWRDIFQNWEALAVSYPEYLPSMIAKFVNASTVDGFNPYRISREGIDWEVPEPDDPWSNIGYWGDHQIIYLLRLLEALHRYRPDALREMLDSPRFTFADVPYRICAYAEMLEHPRDTILFDDVHEARVQGRVTRVGQDGRLVWQGSQPVVTHLWEKLLIPFLSKVSSLVVDGGIWMNTQRPEWNDANNALPGYGISVVTLAHTLRYARFLGDLMADRDAPIRLAPPVLTWLDAVNAVFTELGTQRGPTSATARKGYLDRLGRAFSVYRETVYEGWPKTTIPTDSGHVKGFFEQAADVLAATLRANRRHDGLFHSYNTMSFGEGGVHIHRLPLMLEGQVAALDAQTLSAQAATELVEAMYASALYRKDQDTFLLYPDKTLDDFEQRNRVSADAVKDIAVVRHWLKDGDTRILFADIDGVLHFHPDLKNVEVLLDRLEALEETMGWIAVSDDERQQLIALFEATFRHADFAGRSASMYGYEGLGCVYWHMVAKLLVALQETHARTSRNGETYDGLADMYHCVRGGFCFNKSPGEYGAFPTDAYSHTPGHSGAQQPGMTGQVKEQVLTRFAELGVRMQDGGLLFEPMLLGENELLGRETQWRFVARDGEVRMETIPADGLGFTLAGVPVLFRREPSGEERLELLSRNDAAPRPVPGLRLNPELTRTFLAGGFRRLTAYLAPNRFRRETR